MNLADSSYSQLLTRALDVYALRQRLTASNIANLETPGFKKLSVSFEEELQKVQRSGHGQSLHTVQPEIVQQDARPVLEHEMLEMADTQIRVQVVTRALRHHFDMLKMGISGRSI